MDAQSAESARFGTVRRCDPAGGDDGVAAPEPGRARAATAPAGGHLPLPPVATGVTLPALIDVRDDLDRALAATGGDDELAAEIETVRDRLDAFEERDRADRGGIVDEIDNQLLRIEERLDDEAAARAVRSARNRLHIYRESRQQTDENLAVVDSDVRERDEPTADGVVPVGEVTVRVTVANTGADTEIVPVVTFYDEGAGEIESVRGPEFALAGGEQEQFEFLADAPADAASYSVSVSDTGDVRG